MAFDLISNEISIHEDCIAWQLFPGISMLNTPIKSKTAVHLIGGNIRGISHFNYPNVSIARLMTSLPSQMPQCFHQ
jgi:hypothetical protein